MPLLLSFCATLTQVFKNSVTTKNEMYDYVVIKICLLIRDGFCCQIAEKKCVHIVD